MSLYDDYPKLPQAADQARAALAGYSNDAEHDALVALMDALREPYEIP